MGLAEQEAVLLRLLFDPSLRRRFRVARDETLAALPLDAAERADLANIDPDGLELDAEERAAMVLAHLLRALPLAAGALAALDPSLALVEGALDWELFLRPAHERPVHVADALAAALEAGATDAADEERGLVMALVAWERTACALASDLRAASLLGQADVEGRAAETPPPGWESRPLALGPYLAAARLPAPLKAITAALAPHPPAEAFARLRATPPPRKALATLARSGETRLVLARAVVATRTRCETSVAHRAVELPSSFEVLLPHLDGTRSGADLLAASRRAGMAESAAGSLSRTLAGLVTAGFLTAG